MTQRQALDASGTKIIHRIVQLCPPSCEVLATDVCVGMV
jgi:hypothetical protein